MVWKEGESGNKQGLKARKPIRDALLSLLSRDPSLALDDVPKTIAQRLAMDMIKDAMEGVDRMKARAEVVDRTEGRPAQAIIGGESDDPAINLTLNAILRGIDGRTASLPGTDEEAG